MENTEEKRPHILLCGERQVGKSTLIARLIQDSGRPVCGFVTKMDPAGRDGFHDIYMYPASLRPEERIRTRDNLIGRCDSKRHEIHTDVFETLGVQLIRSAVPGSLLIMDELGFMEAEAKQFTNAVLAALAGDIPVLAAVKLRYDLPFLNAVRAAEKAQVYPVDERCREDLYTYLKSAYPIFRA